MSVVMVTRGEKWKAEKEGALDGGPKCDMAI